MAPVKRLYTFILQSFLPLFFMTFGICLFIVLMQFLWRYIEDLVGKGLDTTVLFELFFYAGLNFIPLALPLAILLAALMTFGNMGERLELLAVKASGISLLKAMRPLIILMAFIAVGGFFFQNEAMPRINVKFRTLLMSIKAKSPELDIPEGSFYNDIEGYSIYVKKKDPKTRMLRDVMIYDTSKGFNDMSVFVCDSARMNISESKDFLLLNLYSGQRFAGFREADPNAAGRRNRNNQYTPYSRENFKQKDIVIRFDANFSRMDESTMEGTQLAKNLNQLKHSIDSMQVDLDSLNRVDRESMFKLYRPEPREETDFNLADSEKKEIPELIVYSDIEPINFDSLIATINRPNLISVLDRAKMKEDNGTTTFYTQSWMKVNLQGRMRQHEIEMHRKFTLSFACIIFFFIGAPLGSIIRKGGMGMPVIISVAFFIVYYIFETLGMKMARDGIWPVWQGMWLSSFVLFPIGVFLTHKSMNDSDLFNTEAYSKYLRKILRIKTKPVADNEQIINPKDIKSLSDLGVDPQLLNNLQGLDSNMLKDIIKNYRQYKYDQSIQPIALAILKERGEDFFDVRLKNIDYEEAKKSYRRFSVSGIITLITYFGAALSTKGGTDAIIIGNVVYLIFFIRTLYYYYDFYNIIDRKQKSNKASLKLFGLYILTIVFFPYLRNEMKRDLDTVI